MTHIDPWLEAMAFSTRTDSRLGGIALSYLATREKIVEMSKVEWYDESLGRFANKTRMKEIGGSTFLFSEFLHENAILALSKVIEDTSIELKRFVKFRFDVIKEPHDVLYLKELRMIRALANVIKHNVSLLERNSSESAKYLVDECGMRDGFTLDAFIHTGHECFNIIEHIPKVYIAIMSLVEKALGVRDPILDLKYDKAFNNIYDHLIPEILNITTPKKLIKSKKIKHTR